MKIDLGQTINTLANVGVIAGIVFLGVEIQQNNALLGSQARTDRTVIRLDSGNQLVGNPHLIDAIVKDRASEPLTPNEEYLLDEWYLATLIRFQYVFVENQEGLIEDIYMPVGGWIATMDGFPGLRRAWERYSASQQFRTDFVQWMEENVVNER